MAARQKAEEALLPENYYRVHNCANRPDDRPMQVLVNERTGEIRNLHNDKVSGMRFIFCVGPALHRTMVLLIRSVCLVQDLASDGGARVCFGPGDEA